MLLLPDLTGLPARPTPQAAHRNEDRFGAKERASDSRARGGGPKFEVDDELWAKGNNLVAVNQRCSCYPCRVPQDFRQTVDGVVFDLNIGACGVTCRGNSVDDPESHAGAGCATGSRPRCGASCISVPLETLNVASKTRPSVRSMRCALRAAYMREQEDQLPHELDAHAYELA